MLSPCPKLIVSLILLAITLSPASGQTTAAVDAFGESAAIHYGPFLGGEATILSEPYPRVSGAAPPAIDVSDSAAGVELSETALGSILRSALLVVSGQSQLPLSEETSAAATVHQLEVGLAGLTPLFSLVAGEVASRVDILGPCGGPIEYVASTQLVDAVLGGSLGASGFLTASPAPNFVLLDAGGIRAVLNEQFVSGDGVEVLEVSVNAIHITLSEVVVAGYGILNGEIIIGHAAAGLTCGEPPPSADLTLSGTVNPETVSVDGVTELGLEVSNLGPDEAVSTVLTVAGPAGTLFEPHPSQADVCVGGSSLNCQLGGLASGSNVSVVATASFGEEGVAVLDALVESTTSDPEPASNSRSFQIDVTSEPPLQADLETVVTVSPNPVSLDSEATLTARVINHGPDAASSVSLSMPLPADAVIVSIDEGPASCSASGTTVSCSFGSIAADATVESSVVVRFEEPGAKSLSASATAATEDPDLANNGAAVSLQVDAPDPEDQADLETVVTVSPNPVSLDSEATLTARVINHGPDAASSVSLSMPLPADAVIVSIDEGPASCSASGTTVSCSFGSIAADATVESSVVVRFDQPGAKSLSASATAATEDPNLANNGAAVSLQVDAPDPEDQADLETVVTVSPNPISLDSEATLNARVINHGPDAASSVSLSMPLPADAVIVSIDEGPASCSASGTTVSCSFGSIAADATVESSVVVRFDQPGAKSLSASATAATEDPDLANNGAAVSLQVDAPDPEDQADLETVVTVSPNPISLDSQATLTARVINHGPDAASSVSLSMPLPADAVIVSIDEGPASCSASGTTVSCSFGSIAADATVESSVVVRFEEPGAKSLSASATAATEDPDLANNGAAVSLQVDAPDPEDQADLETVVTVSPNPVSLDSQATLTARVINHGPDAASSVSLSMPLPADAVIVSIDEGPASCSASGTTVSCSFGSIAADATVESSVVVRFDQPGAKSLSASATAATEDPDLANNGAGVSLQVDAPDPEDQADLETVVTVSPNPVSLDSQATLTARVINHGPDAASSVSLSMPLPADAVIVSIDEGPASCSASGTTVSCSFGSIAADATVESSVVVRFDQPGAKSLSASATAATEDPDLANNGAAVSLQVDAPDPEDEADLGLRATMHDSSITTGDQARVVFRISNQGPSTSRGVSLTWQLPSALGFVSASSDTGSCSSSGCVLNTMSLGMTSVVTVNVSTHEPGPVRVTGSVAADTLDPNASNDFASAEFRVEAPVEVDDPVADLSVSLIAAPNPASVGERIGFFAQLSNNGPSAAIQVVARWDVEGPGVAVEIDAERGDCSGSECRLGTLEPGESVAAVLWIETTGEGALTSYTSVSSDTADPASSNNLAIESALSVNQGSTSPEVELEISPNPAPLGELVRLVSQLGLPPGPGGDSTFLQLLPDSLSPVGDSLADAGCSRVLGGVACDLGDLPGGSTTEVDLEVVGLSTGRHQTEAKFSVSSNGSNSSGNALGELQVTSGGSPTINRAPGVCRIAAEPAATLLFPYFEVDLDDPYGRGTLIAINNASPEPALTRVTLWTDWSVPTLSFDLYLGGLDLQTLSVRQLLAEGVLPSTGSGLHKPGPLSGAGTEFPGCNAGIVAGASPVHAVPAIEPEQIAEILAMHTGQASASSGLCAASPRGDRLATGYITVDVVNRCDVLNPADLGYFAQGGEGVASNANVLWGDFMLVDPSNDYAHGELAVHVKADEAQFGGGSYTFYARYVKGSGADNRQPLGSLFGTRALNGGAFSGGTELLVWRDTKSPDAEPVACQEGPSWGALEQNRVIAFDEEAQAEIIAHGQPIFPLATQATRMGEANLASSFDFGWMLLDLGHSATDLFGTEAQAWVTTRLDASQRFSVGFRAVMLDSVCQALP